MALPLQKSARRAAQGYGCRPPREGAAGKGFKNRPGGTCRSKPVGRSAHVKESAAGQQHGSQGTTARTERVSSCDIAPFSGTLPLRWGGQAISARLCRACFSERSAPSAGAGPPRGQGQKRELAVHRVQHAAHHRGVGIRLGVGAPRRSLPPVSESTCATVTPLPESSAQSTACSS